MTTNSNRINYLVGGSVSSSCFFLVSSLTRLVRRLYCRLIGIFGGDDLVCGVRLNQLIRSLPVVVNYLLKKHTNYIGCLSSRHCCRFAHCLFRSLHGSILITNPRCTCILYRCSCCWSRRCRCYYWCFIWSLFDHN